MLAETPKDSLPAPHGRVALKAKAQAKQPKKSDRLVRDKPARVRLA
jgi:hypothetical protein